MGNRAGVGFDLSKRQGVDGRRLLAGDSCSTSGLDPRQPVLHSDNTARNANTNETLE